MRVARPAPAVRRAILEVRSGPLASSKITIEPGHTRCVGRNNLVDIPVPNDAAMSGRHFTLGWDGERCHLRDLESTSGTWIGGERVAEADVPNGSWIRAGTTNLMVYLEADMPPPEDDDDRPALVEEKAAAVAALAARRAAGRLYAVVDASRGRRPLRLLRESVEAHRSLYEGKKGDQLADSAPYLVAFRDDSGLLDRLVDQGWGARWAIFFVSPQPFTEVRQHLRRFLVVEDDVTATRYYFRFYDPSALRAFIPSCTLRQRAEFFGDIETFFAEGERGELVRFAREAQS